MRAFEADYPQFVQGGLAQIKSSETKDQPNCARNDLTIDETTPKTIILELLLYHKTIAFSKRIN